MKKSVLTLAVLGAFAATGPAVANTATVSGFADITYTASKDGDDAASKAKNSQFTAAAEVDFTATPTDGVTVRVDADLDLSGNGGGSSATLEQAYFAWAATESVTVLGGVFNNPIGLEAEDAPDMWGTNHGVVWNILDHQTSRYGDNIAGLGGAFAVGPATITLAFLNDIDDATDDDGDGQNSIAAVVNFAPIEGLDLELGHVTQEGDVPGTDAGNVTDFNVSYTGVENLSLALDYLTADETVDSAYELMAKYTFPVGVGLGVRFESVEWDGDLDLDDSERTTFHISYGIASNLTAILEVADGDEDNPMTAVTGIEPESVTTLEFIATF